MTIFCFSLYYRWKLSSTMSYLNKPFMTGFMSSVQFICKWIATISRKSCDPHDRTTLITNTFVALVFIHSHVFQPLTQTTPIHALPHRILSRLQQLFLGYTFSHLFFKFLLEPLLKRIIDLNHVLKWFHPVLRYKQTLFIPLLCFRNKNMKQSIFIFHLFKP